MQHLGKRMARGAAWMVALKLSERAFGLVSTVVLARVLIPEDFGLVAMATAVLAIVELLQALGFDITLIRTPDARREHYDTAWTLNLMLAATCALLLVLSAHHAARFYHDPRVEPVIWALAAGVLASGFENIGIVALRKELEFQREFWFRLTKKVITIIVTLSCALALRSYWALVIGMICSRIFGVGLSYVFHPYRPRLSLAEARSFVGFSKWLLLGSVLGVLRTRGAHLLVGRWWAASPEPKHWVCIP
jgi:O-antigen/teichoic acid export membrane protein